MGDERSANAIDKKLGELIRQRRLEIDMSQERLAELIGVTFQQVQKYEKGINRIAASRLFEISKALDISIARIFERLPTKGHRMSEETSAVDAALATAEGVQLVSLFSAVKSVRIRRRIVELVRAVAEEHAGK